MKGVGLELPGRRQPRQTKSIAKFRPLVPHFPCFPFRRQSIGSPVPLIRFSPFRRRSLSSLFPSSPRSTYSVPKSRPRSQFPSSPLVPHTPSRKINLAPLFPWFPWFPWFPRFLPGCDLGSIVRVSIAAKWHSGIVTNRAGGVVCVAGDLSLC